uniref:Uncharacterized protein n=1 Tax=Chelativorans sp. (strain BNC1) TaxID=266779 RepID=Q11N39_CHESB
MRFQTRPRGRTVESIISVHRKTRSIKFFIQNNSTILSWIVFSSANRLVGLYEARVLRKLITVGPITAEDAQKKLLYLTALLAAKSIDPSTREIEAAIRTLRPFKAELAATVCRRSDVSVHPSR